MRILHFSDNHGILPKWDLTGVDAIVCSGDFCPNWSRGIRAIEEPRQIAWLEQNAEELKTWLQDKPLLFVAGNHDFVDIPRILKYCGLNIIDLCIKDNEGRQRPVDFGGLRWYGSPWVPTFTGEWNYELSDDCMSLVVDEALLNNPDIIVSHCPIKGVRDLNRSRIHCGAYDWKRGLMDSISAGKSPKHFLHGHIHESAGVTLWNGINVVNAATTYYVLDL